MSGLKISEVARELEISTDWLREAEKRGKIPAAARDMNGWRTYSLEDVRAIRRILTPKRSEG